jgi:hypothetical protein
MERIVRNTELELIGSENRAQRQPAAGLSADTTPNHSRFPRLPSRSAEIDIDSDGFDSGEHRCS